MGAANTVNPQEEASSKPADGSILLWLVKDGPAWARIPAVCAALLVTVVPTLLLFVNGFRAVKGSVAEAPTATQLQLGVSAKLKAEQDELEQKLKDALTQGDREKVVSQFGIEIKHEIDHLSNPVDQAAPCRIVEKSTTNDYWGYKLFPSDGCLLIARVKGDYYGSQWIKDPRYHTNDHAAGAIITPGVRAATVASATNLHLTVYHPPTAPAEPEDFVQQLNSTHLQRVQASCLNPHPGPFEQSWGPYINQCQQPTYRRWADGCVHVQIYDHCQNIWGPIQWQFCAPRHSW
jgi:hypothetical protein